MLIPRKSSIWSILFLLLFLILSACEDKEVKIPSDVLSKKEMMEVLMDIHTADALIENKMNTNAKEKEATLAEGYYTSIFKQHKVSKEKFYNSYRFYQDHPDLLDAMYADMITELSKREAQVNK